MPCLLGLVECLNNFSLKMVWAIIEELNFNNKIVKGDLGKVVNIIFKVEWINL